MGNLQGGLAIMSYELHVNLDEYTFIEDQSFLNVTKTIDTTDHYLIFMSIGYF